MTFGEPYWLLGLLFLPVLILLCARNDGRTRERLQKLVAARLLPVLSDSVSVRRRLLKRLFFMAALGCIMVALARPQWGILQVRNAGTNQRGELVFSILATAFVPRR